MRSLKNNTALVFAFEEKTVSVFASKSWSLGTGPTGLESLARTFWNVLPFARHALSVSSSKLKYLPGTFDFILLTRVGKRLLIATLVSDIATEVNGQ